MDEHQWAQNRGMVAENERLRSDLRAAAEEFSKLECKLGERDHRVTALGYDDFDALQAVFQRNVKWLDAIGRALRLYRGCSLTKTEAEAFRDLTSAIEEPPQ